MVQLRFLRSSIGFILFFVAALLLISSPLSNDFILLTVEIVGAFVGIVGALACNRSAQELGQLWEARSLKRGLLNSMHIMLGQRSREDPKPWIFYRYESALRRGEFALLERATDHEFFLVNLFVEMNNECVKEYRECLDNPDASRKPCNVLREVALNTEKVLIEKTLEMLEKHGIKLKFEE